MVDRRFIVVFGETELDEGVVTATTLMAMNNVSSAEVVIINQELIGAKVDYQATVRLFLVTDSQHEILFTGIVDEVTPGENETGIRLVSGLQLLDEVGIGGLGIGAGVGFLEAAWSVLRTAGIPEDKIAIEDFQPGPLEVFEVATALDGIEIDDPTSLGGVRLLSAGPVSRLADGLGPDELRESYVGASAWALTLQNARTIFEAESEGLKTIDGMLAWLTTLAHYSAAALPGGSPRRFRRAWTRSRMLRRDVVVVRGVATGRRWLRAPTDIPHRPTLALREIEDLESIPLPSTLSDQTREALVAWRRAAEEPDPLAAVVALWEAVEFYAAGAKASEAKMFSKSERKAIRDTATRGLQGDKLERVKEVLAMLNEPSLMVRLRAALKEDQVPYTEEEFLLLRRVREARNDFVHGRSREAPSQDEVRYANAIVNRMLVYRISSLTTLAKTITAPEQISPSLFKKLSRVST